MIGELIGNFRILSRLGEGGMGEVFLAEQTSIETKVAVKMLRADISRQRDHVQRFFNEARAAAKIKHAGIRKIFDVGFHHDRAYLIMEFLEGETLTDRIKQQGRLPLVQVGDLGRQIASVLESTHREGIIHRDLKPDNIYIVPDGELVRGERVKVLDFGIAKLTGTLAVASPRTIGVMGTAAYMPPEQWGDAGEIDWRADLYSLGCVLFEMICGHPPFQITSLQEAYAKHVGAPPPRALSLVPGVPAALDALLDRMLAKRPVDRPASLREVMPVLASLATVPEPPRPDIATRVAALQRAELSQVAPEVTAPPEYMVPTIGGDHVASASPVAPPLLEAPSLAHGSMIHIAPSTSHPPHAPLPLTSRRASRTYVWIALVGTLAIGSIASAVALGSDSKGPRATDTTSAALPVAEQPTSPVPDAALPPDAPPPDAVPPPTPAIVVPPLVPPPVPPDEAAELAARCLDDQTKERWSELERCAGELKVFDPDVAAKYKARAVNETRSIARSAGVEAALRDRNLKKARAELDGVWPGARVYAGARRKYDAAEAVAIADLVARLGRAKGSDCREYTAILTQEQQAKPPRVAAEAARQVRCTCDADALGDKAKAQFGEVQYAAAVASYELALTCRPGDLVLIQKAFIAACNLRSLQKAKPFWRQLTAGMRLQAHGVCVRNGITEEMLNAP